MTTEKALMAETAVIGSIMIHNELIEDVLAELKEEDFSAYFLQRAFVAITQMRKRDPQQAIDLITLTTFMKTIHQESENDIFIQLAEVANYSLQLPCRI